MSVTTTGNRLSRRQNSQMPALLEFYSPSAALMETRTQGAARGVVYTVATLFVACALAAGLIPIDKVVTAPGKVVAAQSTIVVQPLETAIVREIDVQAGDVVRKGQLLAKLDPTFTSSDKNALGLSVASLQAEVDRLTAEAAGTDYQPGAAEPSSQVQQAIFAQRKAERTFRLENFKQKIDGLQATLSKDIGDIQSYTDRLQVASTVEGKRRELEQLGWGSALTRLQSTDQRMEMQRGLQNAQQEAKTAAGDLQAMRADAAAYDQDWHAKVSQSQTEAGRKLDEARGNLTKATMRSSLVELRADQDAIVLSRAPVSVGSVLQSGDQFLRLVPKDAPTEIDATVSASDAGFMHVGNKVMIKFDTFPFTQYGSAEGTVRVVSPDSFTGQQQDQVVRGTDRPEQAPSGQSYYRIKISLDQVNLHDTPPDFRITPGLPVTSDIMVGKNTVLGYIFSRVLPVTREGMREP